MASTARSTSSACGLILSSRSKFPYFPPPPFFRLFRGGDTKKAFQKHLKVFFRQHWSGRRGSNSRQSAWKADALPTELLPQEERGRRWIRTTEVVRQQIYSLPHLATLVFARIQRTALRLQIYAIILIAQVLPPHFFSKFFPGKSRRIFPPPMEKMSYENDIFGRCKSAKSITKK